MGVFADKLKQAGYDTFEQQFAALAIKALQKHPESVIDAWRFMGEQFGWKYLRERMKDMRGSNPVPSPPTPLSRDMFRPGGKPYTPRVKPTLENTPGAKEIKKKIVEIMFNYKLPDGRDAADWGAHELDRYDQTGRLAGEIKKELPQLTGNMRFANLRDLISAKQFDAARERANV